MNKYFILIVIGLLLGFSTQGNAQATKGVVRGEVFDENGLLPGVSISVSDITTRINTDADGAFAIKLEPGTYRFSFYFPEYKEEIEKVVVIEDKIKDLEIELFINYSEPKTLETEETEYEKLLKSGESMFLFVKQFLLRLP